MSDLSPSKRVAGHGSAREGVSHFNRQRATAIALLFLIPFFAYTLAAYGHRHEALIVWLGHAPTAAAMVALIAVVAFHAWLGVRVVIEDYIHAEGFKVAALLIASFGLTSLAVLGAVLALGFFLGG